MSYQFIDNKLSIDQAARKQIRRHAATGKNRGKKNRAIIEKTRVNEDYIFIRHPWHNKEGAWSGARNSPD